VEKMSCPDFSRAWNEARQKLTEALTLMREILEAAMRELSESEKRLKQSFTSVDGTLEKLGIDPRANRPRA
jgi:hypothetical protein